MTATGRWCAMRQKYRARLSKVGGNVLIGAFVAAYVAFRVGLAVVFVLGLWYVSEPIRVLVAGLWELIPAGARSTMVFQYLRGVEAGKGAVRFDCERFPNKDPKACMRSSAQQPAVLSGVRFKTSEASPQKAEQLN